MASKAVSGVSQGPEFTIKPEAVVPAVDTSEWPLLLRNYDQCTSLSHHPFIPRVAIANDRRQYSFVPVTLHPFLVDALLSSATSNPT